MTDESIASCFASLKKGDREAFAELYDGMSRPLFTVILRVVGERAAAEDILQDLFCRLWEKREEIAVSSPRACLFTAAQNGALSYLRREKKDGGEIGEDIPSPDSLSVERKMDLERAFAALPPSVRAIVALRLNGGLTFKEIAKAARLPLGTVLTRYRKGIMFLRDVCR